MENVKGAPMHDTKIENRKSSEPLEKPAETPEFSSRSKVLPKPELPRLAVPKPTKPPRS
ncbi:MAG: hypothetical protein UY03_C0024G0017 [Parcubacteria group bacterium GW2011_GWA2_47_64]|nr:MAG: hypothetical protein UY03_C0024G0017 [Parcubacteria group bacterium GW2011_GWA2_47_64]KKU97013.1 MAG: hypothetical protein UY29_C0003G0010 [Parcubacteria group bacterium GW2011_GWC2_48_17]